MCIPHDITDVAYNLFAVQPFNKTLFGKILFVKERKYVVFIYIIYVEFLFGKILIIYIFKFIEFIF